MSLINEALKRASLNRAKPSPPAPELGMALAEHEPARGGRWAFIAAAAVAVLGLSAFFLVRGLQTAPAQTARPTATPVVARQAAVNKRNPAPGPSALRSSPPAGAPKTAAARPAGSPVPAKAPVAVAAPAKAPLAPVRTGPPAPVRATPSAPALAQSPKPALNSPAPAPKSAATDNGRKAPGAPAGAPALKLQAIFYRPSNPSVMINGTTFFRGDEFKGLKVVAIEPQRVTVQWNGQTRVLTLR